MRIISTALMLAAMLASPAAAATIRYDFAGMFTTSDTASSFAVEGGFTSGTGSYNGFVEFDTAAPGPTDFAATAASLSIGSYTLHFADPGFSTASAHVDPSEFSLLLLSAEDFSAANSFFELLSFTISFPSGMPGIEQHPDPSSGSVSVNFGGDLDALNGSGTLTRFDVTGAMAVPEPATWAMMIGGFGMIGASMRRRAREYQLTALA